MKKRHTIAFVLAWVLLAAGLAGLLSLSLGGNAELPKTPGSLLAVPLLAAGEVLLLVLIAACLTASILLAAALRRAPSVPRGIKTAALVSLFLAAVTLAAEAGVVLLATLPID